MRYDNLHYPVATSCPLWPIPAWSPICGTREEALRRRPYQMRPIPVPVTPVVLGPPPRRVMYVVQDPPAEKKSDLGPFLAATGIAAGLLLLYTLMQNEPEQAAEPRKKRRRGTRKAR